MHALKSIRESADAELITAALEGSEAAFGTLIERYQDRVGRLLARYCRDRAECEDLAQEVFVKVIRAGFLPDHRMLHGAFSRLEACAVEVPCTVRRGRGGGSATLPPDLELSELSARSCERRTVLPSMATILLGNT